MLAEDIAFFKGKKVLVTGHTGFKGSWMCKVLVNAGASVIGYSTCSPREPALLSLAGLEGRILSVAGDIRDYGHLLEVFEQTQPEVVIHMAAQPIVKTGYEQPVLTYETNVMGTVNLLECVRHNPCVKSLVNVTTDKVYHNNEWVWGYRENEPLDGFDPYSNSKSCSELVTHCYFNSYFQNRDLAVSTARAGNVIGGGDFSRDRIIPDCVRSMKAGISIQVRNPYSIRPYQHVLEPVTAYLMIAAKQAQDRTLAGWYNVGPDEKDCVSTGDLVKLFCEKWGDGASWESHREANPVHEANFLKLDCSLLKSRFGWKPRWGIDEAVEKTCEWTRVYFNKGDLPIEMDREIEKFLTLN